MAKKKKKKKVRVLSRAGRKSIYRATFPEMAYKLCLLGVTDAMMAEVFEVSEATLNTWKKKHPLFLESLKKGKVQADAEVAKALFRRACGYSHPDVHISNFQGKITVIDITKHYPPDTAAAFIWLKNRAGWKDKQLYEHSGEISLKPPIIT
ncbi:MAG: hypothetical protein MUO31_13120 [Thermodesulfovibrionales bacterium]|nr:hypothetical protein [Thermodesulfovibrionales bacterium]